MSRNYEDIKGKLSHEAQFHVERLLEMEATMEPVISGASRFPESQFRRQGLPLLTMMLDDTFDPQLWANYVGSMFVPLEVVADDNYDNVLFTFPPVMHTGHSLRQVEGQASLSEESSEIYNQTLIMASTGHRMMASLIKDTLGGIESIAHRENTVRAYNTINTLNFVFERYGVAGRVPMPEGLEEAALRFAGKAVPAGAKAGTSAAASTEQGGYNGGGEDL